MRPVVILCALFAVGAAPPKAPPVVPPKAPPVIDTAYFAADPDQPAPQGYQWQRREGEPWQLVKLAAPEVVVFPFQPGSTPDTTAPSRGAAGVSTSSPAPVPFAGRTFTPARRVILGGTECGTLG